MFTIYYLNFNKTYEIKTMLSDTIKIGSTIESFEGKETNSNLQAKLGVSFLELFNVDVGSSIKASSTDSQKVLESFKVVMTKSLILNEVIEQCKEFLGFDTLLEGELIKIDRVRLSLINENEIRAVKTLSNGILKGLKLPETGDWEIGNVFNSFFKDYSYKLQGAINQQAEMLLIKIPFASDNEFENSYCVDDLFIGEVSVVGIYKGKVSRDQITNTFEFFQDQNKQNSFDDEVHSSQGECAKVELVDSSKDEYHYFDLIAVIQDIKSTAAQSKDAKAKMGSSK